MTTQDILYNLARAKVEFQLRSIELVMGMIRQVQEKPVEEKREDQSDG